MINVDCGVGSTGRICKDLADVLSGKGHEVKIAFGRESSADAEAKYGVRIGNKLSVYKHVLRARALDGVGFGSRSETKKFIEWVKSFDPDIIHLHNIHGYYLNIEVLFEYLKICGKTIVWTLHDCWSFTGHCAYFDMAHCDKWKVQCHDCVQKKAYPKSHVDCSKRNFEKKKKLFTEINNLTIVIPSLWLKKLVEESYLQRYDTVVIPNGIDLDAFSPIHTDIKERYNIDKKIILGVAGVWDERKGLKDFIVLDKFLSKEYQIVLIGIDSKNKALLEDTHILPINKTNSVAELSEWYSAAEFFFNPTYEDNFPTVNIEALACDTPVITYNTGGSPEALSYQSGKVVSCGNVNEVRNIILKGAPPKSTCRTRALKFSKLDKYEEYCELYTSLIEKRVF